MGSAYRNFFLCCDEFCLDKIYLKNYKLLLLASSSSPQFYLLRRNFQRVPDSWTKQRLKIVKIEGQGPTLGRVSK